jgi:hypothetical protein
LAWIKLYFKATRFVSRAPSLQSKHWVILAFVFAFGLRLKKNGYRVPEAATGEEGLAKAAESRPDTVLLESGVGIRLAL